MLTDELRRAGYRHVSTLTEQVWDQWLKGGGLWQGFDLHGRPSIQSYVWDLLWRLDHLEGCYRPVDANGDHFRWMWHACTGEDLTPTEDGLHFLFEYEYEWKTVKVVRCGREGDPRFGRLFVDQEIGKEMQWVPGEKVEGRWGGPCTGLPPEGFWHEQ